MISNGEFNFPSLSSVVYGRGSVQRVGEKVEELGAGRALVVTVAPIMSGTDLVARVKKALGNKYAGVFDGVVEHVPRACVIKGASMASEAGADILISLGGSSTSDAAKAMRLVMTEGDKIESFFDKFPTPDAVPPSQYAKIKVNQIAIPTTLSGGEFTTIAGITDTEKRVKEGISSARLTPGVIILDPEMAAFTPGPLWAATGMKVLSDAFSKVCSTASLPFSDALQLHAIRLINEYLPPSIGEPVDLEARGMLLHTVWMSMYGNRPLGLGIIASLRHQIGGGYGVPHGVASTIVFPYCLDFYRPLIDGYLVQIARALDLTGRDAAGAVVDRVRELIRQAALPARLRDAGVPRDGLKFIAEASMKDWSTRSSIKPIEIKHLSAILEKAW